MRPMRNARHRRDASPTSAVTVAAVTEAGPMTALRIKLFRLLMMVQLMNAVAVWVHVVGVQWMLTERGESPVVVSLAPAALAVPFIVLALPAGAIVSHARRERLIALAALASGLSGAAGAWLVVVGADSAIALLLTVLVVGVALVLIGVSWQSLLPEIVPRRLVPAAAMVDGAVFNMARALGPLVAGVLLGLGQPVVVFGVAAMLCMGSVVMVVLLAGTTPARAGGKESIGAAIKGALWFTRHSSWTRGLLGRMVAFGVPASALWALVSLAIHDRFGVGAAGFGIAMALLGLGSVAAIVFLGAIRARLKVHVFVSVLAAAYAVNLVALAVLHQFWLLVPFLVLGGVAWVAVQSTWMVLAHQALPDWVRPRIVALLLMLFQGSQAIGALLWGVVADLVGVAGALGLAAALLLFYAGALLFLGLRSSDGIEPVLANPASTIAELIGATGDGPLVVSYEYDVEDAQRGPFTRTMGDLRSSRLRLGARAWTLEPHAGRSGSYVESYVVRDRSLLLEQETLRLTVPEQRLRDDVRSCCTRVAGPLLVPALIPSTPTPANRRTQGDTHE